MVSKNKKQVTPDEVSFQDFGPRLTKKEVVIKTAQGEYFRNPAQWVPDATGIILDPWQIDAMNKLFAGGKNKVSVAASHGAGKTFLSGIVVNFFLSVFTPARVAITGPTGKQTRNQIWSNVNIIWDRSVYKDDFAWQKTKFYLKGKSEETYAVWMTSKEPKTIEGFHGPDGGKNLLWMVEEGKAVADPVYESIQGALSNDNNFMYIGSTCGGAAGFFFKTFHTLKHSWDNIKVPWYESSRISPQQVETWKETWGEDSPIFRARVMAEFPEEDEQVIVPLPWLERAVIQDDYEEMA